MIICETDTKGAWLRERSLQETFDAVARALAKQGKPAARPNPLAPTAVTCGYRVGELKCAVGHLIPDALYDTTFEGEMADAGEVGDLMEKLGHDRDLCRALQDGHDFATSPHINSEDGETWLDRWVASMRRIATCYSLNTSALDEALKETHR